MDRWNRRIGAGRALGRVIPAQAPSAVLARGSTPPSGDTPDPDGPGTPRWPRGPRDFVTGTLAAVFPPAGTGAAGGKVTAAGAAAAALAGSSARTWAYRRCASTRNQAPSPAAQIAYSQPA